MPEWISVKDRLPDSCGVETANVIVSNTVLVLAEDAIYFGFFNILKKNNSFVFSGYDEFMRPYDGQTVTHWMPLPEGLRIKGGMTHV